MRTSTTKKARTKLAGVLVATLTVGVLAGCSAEGLGQKVEGLLQRVPFLSESTSTTKGQSVSATPRRPQAVEDSALITPGTLTVGVNPTASGVPMSCVEDDQVKGMDVDLGSALADALGLRVQFVVVSDAGTDLGTTCDLVMDQAEDASGAYALADTYGQSAVAVFHKGDMGVAKAEDLSSKNVGVQTGSKSESTLDQTGLTVAKKGYATLNEAFADLNEGGVDFVVCDAYAGAYLARLYGDVSFAGTLDAPVPMGVACANGNATLSAALSGALGEVKGNGVYDLLRTRWLGDLPTLDETTQVQGMPAKAESTDQAGSDETAADAGSADATASDAAAGDGSTAGSNAASV